MGPRRGMGEGANGGIGDDGGFVPSKKCVRCLGKIAIARRWSGFSVGAVGSFGFCVFLRRSPVRAGVLRGLHVQLTWSGRAEGALQAESW